MPFQQKQDEASIALESSKKKENLLVKRWAQRIGKSLNNILDGVVRSIDHEIVIYLVAPFLASIEPIIFGTVPVDGFYFFRKRLIIKFDTSLITLFASSDFRSHVGIDENTRWVEFFENIVSAAPDDDARRFFREFSQNFALRGIDIDRLIKMGVVNGGERNAVMDWQKGNRLPLGDLLDIFKAIRCLFLDFKKDFPIVIGDAKLIR